MKEFIDKLIERLEGQIFSFEERLNYDSKTQKQLIIQNNSIKRAISIVNELAEEYKGGWIACSERLPELTEGTEYFKQSKCCLVALKWWDGDITESVAWYNQSGVWNEDSKNCKVIAWQPLPAPYTEGE